MHIISQAKWLPGKKTLIAMYVALFLQRLYVGNDPGIAS
jgi:hypothetical protein